MKNWIKKYNNQGQLSADTADSETASANTSTAISPSWFKDMQTAILSNRTSQVLSAVLATQLLFAAGLYRGSADNAEFATPGSLVALDPEQVEEVVIKDEDNTITLKRADANWHIAGDSIPQMLPVDSAKLDEALASLSDLKTGLPVAMTESSQRQLEVASDNYQRHVSLYTSGQTSATDLYFGTSPGFRKAHVRKAGEDSIYAAKVNVFDLPTSVDRWLDKQLLSFSDISRIEADQFIIEKTDDQWKIVEPTALSDSHYVIKTTIDELVDSLETFSVTGVSETLNSEQSSEQDHPAPLLVDNEIAGVQQSDPLKAIDSIASVQSSESTDDDDTSTLVFTIAAEGGNVSELNMSKKDDDVTVTHSDWSIGFSAPVSLFDKLDRINAESLFSESPPTPASEAGGDNQYE